MSDNLREKAAARIDDAKAKASDAYARGRDKAEDAVHNARVKTEDAARHARDAARKAADSARASGKRAAAKTGEGVDRNPLAAIAGGLAIGAIIASFLPRTGREDRIAGNVGRKVRGTASKAASTARATAKEQLDELGVNADAARDQLRDLVGKISKAAGSAGTAAAKTIRKD
jgi:ElaB/YqjD/DUF883 family membrane-anchored ribosome-binding protein